MGHRAAQEGIPEAQDGDTGERVISPTCLLHTSQHVKLAPLYFNQVAIPRNQHPVLRTLETKKNKNDVVTLLHVLARKIMTL